MTTIISSWQVLLQECIFSLHSKERFSALLKVSNQRPRLYRKSSSPGSSSVFCRVFLSTQAFSSYVQSDYAGIYRIRDEFVRQLRVRSLQWCGCSSTRFKMVAGGEDLETNNLEENTPEELDNLNEVI